MKTYLYKVLDNSSKRGFNRTIIVYRVKHNKPYRIAFNEDIQTKAYKGDKLLAMDMISNVDGGDTYAKIKAKKVTLIEI